MSSSRLYSAIQRSWSWPRCWYSGTSTGRGLRGTRGDTVPLTQQQGGPEVLIVSSDLTLTVHLPDPSTGGTRAEPVYLDTVKMKMTHGPMLYFPFADPKLNTCTLWNFVSTSFLKNKVTPIAMDAPPPQSITTKDSPTETSRFEMYAATGGETLYFVPISFVQGQAQDTSNQIVAAAKISLIDKDNTFVWSQEEVP